MSNYTMPSTWISIARYLENLTEDNCLNSEEFSKFETDKIQPISLINYIERLCRYFGCSSSCMILAFIYISRAMKEYSRAKITRLNVHR